MMGDFNITLLTFESHHPTDDFINTLGSYFFAPQISQPRRVTDHSATLIDNIFFNSLEHHSISGNIVHDLTDHHPNFLVYHQRLKSSREISLISMILLWLMKSGPLIGVLLSQILMMLYSTLSIQSYLILLINMFH